MKVRKSWAYAKNPFHLAISLLLVLSVKCTISYSLDVYNTIYTIRCTAEVCVRFTCPNIYRSFIFSDPLLFAKVSNKVSVSLVYQATIHNFGFWTVCAAAVASADFFLSRNLVIRVSIIFSSISLVKYVK